jgi:AraC-like DNA-binding protein
MLTQNLAYVAAFGCLIFAAHLFLARPTNKLPARLLGACFLLSAAQAFLLGARLGGWLPQPLWFLGPTLAMTLAPLLYLFFESAADPSLRMRHALHALPAAAIALEFLTGLFPIDVDLAIFASFAGYAAALGLRMRGGSARFGHLGDGQASAFRLLTVAAMLLAGSFATDIVIYADIVRGAPLSSSPALLATLLAKLALIGLAIITALLRPSPFDWVYVFGGAAPPACTADAAQIADCAAFDRLIASERIWLEDGTRLSLVARRLGLPARRLSEAINAVHRESFSRRMNRLRVEEAKRLLRDRPDLSIYAVMLDAGFRTKSSFNREFRMLVGTSPSEYRQRIQK